jgi:PAS domain S-box-containing protein
MRRRRSRRARETIPATGLAYDKTTAAQRTSKRNIVTTQDDTDKQGMAHALRESEVRWHALAEAMPQLVWTCTADGRCDYLSRQWVEYTGKPESEQLGYGWLEQVHTDDSENLIAAWLRTVQTGEQFEAEFRIRRADGAWRWFIARATPLRDAEGRIVKWYGSSSDIDDLKRTEAALARERAVLAGIMNATDVMLVYLDRDFNFVWVNPAYAQTCRMHPQEMIGKNHFALYPHAENEAIFRRVLDTHEPVFYKDKPFEFPDQPERGVTYWDWSLMPVTDPENPKQVIGLVFSLRETTKYKRAEMALAKSEESLQLALEVGRAGTWDWDLRNGKVVWSRGHYEILGYRVGEVTPSYAEWAKRLHPEDRPRVENELRRTMAARTDYVADFRVIWPDGSLHWMNARARGEYGEDGACRRMIGVMADVTERKQAELALQEADRRKDEFLAMLAHELRNPLAPIRNAAHILGGLQPDEPRITWARDTIERHVAHMTRLVDDLVDLSLIVQGRIVLKRERVELASLIGQALESVRPLMQAREQKYEIRLPSQPVWLEGDPARLVQVLLNLIENAAKYSPPGAGIEIASGLSGRDVRIEVIDHGIGIPVHLLPHVFELFRQGERSLDRSQGGMGIGLTMVRRLVELHGGRVEVESAGADQGATFTVHLPRAAPAAARVDVRTPDRPATRAVNVLVVDDDAAVADSTALLLEVKGHNVRVAHSGAEAIDLAREFRPRVVLLDIGMQGINGYETAARLRQSPGGRAMCLVAVTGYGDEQTRLHSRAAGFDYHLVKPVHPNELCTLINDVAAGNPPSLDLR